MKPFTIWIQPIELYVIPLIDISGRPSDDIRRIYIEKQCKRKRQIDTHIAYFPGGYNDEGMGVYWNGKAGKTTFANHYTPT